MPNYADESLTKITLNLYTKDVKILRARFGQGWSERVRQKVRKWIREMENDDE